MFGVLEYIYRRRRTYQSSGSKKMVATGGGALVATWTLVMMRYKWQCPIQSLAWNKVVKACCVCEERAASASNWGSQLRIMGRHL